MFLSAKHEDEVRSYSSRLDSESYILYINPEYDGIIKTPNDDAKEPYRETKVVGACLIFANLVIIPLYKVVDQIILAKIKECAKTIRKGQLCVSKESGTVWEIFPQAVYFLEYLHIPNWKTTTNCVSFAGNMFLGPQNLQSDKTKEKMVFLGTCVSPTDIKTGTICCWLDNSPTYYGAKIIHAMVFLCNGFYLSKFGLGGDIVVCTMKQMREFYKDGSRLLYKFSTQKNECLYFTNK